jgi:hypothetical protein
VCPSFSRKVQRAKILPTLSCRGGQAEGQEDESGGAGGYRSSCWNGMMQDNQGAMPTLAASGPIMSGTGIPHELAIKQRQEENFDFVLNLTSIGLGKAASASIF